MEDHIKPMEFAKKFNLSQTTVNEWIRGGKIKAIKLQGSKRAHYRIPLSEVERFEKLLVPETVKIDTEDTPMNTTMTSSKEMPVFVPGNYSATSMNCDDLVRGILVPSTTSTTTSSTTSSVWIPLSLDGSATSSTFTYESSTTQTTRHPYTMSIKQRVNETENVLCNNWLDLDYGSKGPTGPTGPQGPQGCIGNAGIQGSPGSIGAMGPTGLLGNSGKVSSYNMKTRWRSSSGTSWNFCDGLSIEPEFTISEFRPYWCEELVIDYQVSRPFVTTIVTNYLLFKKEN
jgi:excisionase family DNA binding protein